MIILRKTIAAAALFAGLTMAVAGPASAYSCKAVYTEAEDLIKEAEKLVKPNTDSRILALIEKAKGIADAGYISHTKASQGHVGPIGKHMHGQAVSMGRQAQAVAKEALFLLTGETR